MGKIHIVTDSTSDISEAIREQLGIHVVPLNVHFGDDTLKDGIGISSAEFFARLQTDVHHPKTSQPSPENFMRIYKELLQGDDEIISLHISGKMSGTVQSALLAKKEIGATRITVVDTEQTCLALGMLVTRIAKMVQNGATLNECIAFVEHVRKNMQTYFVVDSLECLQRGGRIGKAASLLGGILHIKPILMLKDGQVQAFEKVRGSSRVFKRMGELFAHFITDQKAGEIMLGFAHAQDEAMLLRLQNQVALLYTVKNAEVYEIGSVIGAHLGFGALSIAFCPAMQ